MTFLRTCCTIAILSGLLTGCAGAARLAARMYGYPGDAMPGPCKPESLQAGYCIPEKRGDMK